MNIKLNDKYRITSDKHCLVLQEKKYPNPNSKLTKDPSAWKWVDVGYYGKFKHLVGALLEKEIRESEAESLQDILDHIERVQHSTNEDLEVLSNG